MSLGSRLLKFVGYRPDRDYPAGSSFSVKGERVTVTYDSEIRGQMAMCHPVMYRCLNKIATAVQHTKWYAEKDDTPDGKGIKDSDLQKIQQVLDNPNDVMSADQLRYWQALTFACFGRVPMKFGIGALGNVNAVYPLYAGNTKADPDPRGLVQGYIYQTGENEERLPIRKRAASGQAYAFEIFTPNLRASQIEGGNTTPLNALGLPAQIITLLLKRAIDTASGHPNTKYVVVAERSLTTQQKDAITKHLEEAVPGDIQSGQVLIVYNSKVEIHKLDNNLDDIHSKVPMDDMSRMIAGAFGIPVSLLGLAAADGAKFAGNYVESRRSFWEDTVIPGYLSPIEVGMTKAMCPPGIRICFDLDSIEALRDVRTTRAKELTLVSFLEQNEKRDMCGFEPLAYELAPSVPGVLPNNPKPKKPKPDNTK